MRQIRKILIIDSENHASETREIIRKSAVAGSIDIAVTAREAIRYIEQREFLFPEQLPDLALLEINLPSGGGITFLESYANLNTDLHDKVHLVILTDDDQTKAALMAGADKNVEEIILKPIAAEKINQLCEKIAEGQKK